MLAKINNTTEAYILNLLAKGEGGGVKNLQNLVNVVYECPLAAET